MEAGKDHRKCLPNPKSKRHAAQAASNQAPELASNCPHAWDMRRKPSPPKPPNWLRIVHHTDMRRKPSPLKPPNWLRIVHHTDTRRKPSPPRPPNWLRIVHTPGTCGASRVRSSPRIGFELSTTRTRGASRVHPGLRIGFELSTPLGHAAQAESAQAPELASNCPHPWDMRRKPSPLKPPNWLRIVHHPATPQTQPRPFSTQTAPLPCPYQISV
jgi:hypothetical protein